MEISENIFEKNIELLSRIVPEVALRVQYMDASDVKWCKTREDEPNLQRDYLGKTHFYHSNYSAKKEADKWFKSLKLEEIDVLYVYGVGLGYYYDAIKPWLMEDPGHYVVFLEDDMAVMRRFMETDQATKILDDKQVQLHYFQDIVRSGGMINWLTWYFIRMRPEVSALEYYMREREEYVWKLRLEILHDTVLKESVSAEYMRCGETFHENFFWNTLHLPKSYHGTKLFGKFKGVPAIICGAGPSLNKNFDVLKTLSNRALIFAGGSSLNALSYRHFLPHFCAGIDPNPAQYERLMTNFGYEVPFFYRGRMHHKAFRAIHGPRLYLNGTGGYKVAEWFEKKVDIRGPCIEEGHNVINMLIDIARKLGCSPIITVGMDLSYTGMLSYAEGVLGDNSVKEEEIVNVHDLESGAFQRDDIHGKPVYTLWKWVSESEWIGAYAKFHDDTEFVNATEGGLGFPGVVNMTLQEVADKFLSRRYDMWTRVHSSIQNAKLPDITDQDMLEYMKELYDSMRRCDTLCQGLIEEIEIMEENVKARKKVPHNLQTGKAALYETELGEEPGYEYVVGVLGMVYSKVMERRLHQIRYDWTLRSDTERNMEVLKVNRDKVRFVQQSIQRLRAIMERVVRDYGKMGNDVARFFDEAVV